MYKVKLFKLHLSFSTFKGGYLGFGTTYKINIKMSEKNPFIQEHAIKLKRLILPKAMKQLKL